MVSKNQFARVGFTNFEMHVQVAVNDPLEAMVLPLLSWAGGAPPRLGITDQHSGKCSR